MSLHPEDDNDTKDDSAKGNTDTGRRLLSISEDGGVGQTKSNADAVHTKKDSEDSSAEEANVAKKREYTKEAKKAMQQLRFWMSHSFDLEETISSGFQPKRSYPAINLSARRER